MRGPTIPTGTGLTRPREEGRAPRRVPLRRLLPLVAVLCLGAGLWAGLPDGPRPPDAWSAEPDAPADGVPAALKPPQPLQGPALAMPREILAMLDQRKQALDRREEELRAAEARLLVLRQEIEAILARYEETAKAAEARRQAFEAKQAAADSEARKRELAQVAKIYETMPPEEAAARIEKLPREKALRILRLLKGKTAGAILAQVRPDKAARLTERFVSGQ